MWRNDGDLGLNKQDFPITILQELVKEMRFVFETIEHHPHDALVILVIFYATMKF